MASLPVPANTFFKDFEFNLLEYKITRNSIVISTCKGMSNKDEEGKHIAFLIDCDVQVNDILVNGNHQIFVKEIDFDTYNGKPDMIKAYY